MNITSQITDETVLAELGRRVERLRLDRNLTQDQLAKEAGISRPTLERIESGGVAKLPAFIRVLRALDVLDALDSLLPMPAPSPIEQLERRGRQRQRARPAKTSVNGHEKDSRSWEWGTP